jgi:hypothetical protein
MKRTTEVTVRAMCAFILLPLATAGCIRRETTTVDVTPGAMATDIRTATNLPDRFVVITPSDVTGGCPQQLRDAGLHTTLHLQRSLMHQVSDSAGAAYRTVGDYAVEPRGRYGEEQGEGLRVDCGHLRALGVVPL